MDEPPCINLSHVNAGYDGHVVLHDISLTLPAGRNVSVIGPNGSGKTTLLRVLAGLLPYTGEVFLSLPAQTKDDISGNNPAAGGKAPVKDDPDTAASMQLNLSALPRRRVAELIALMPQFSESYFSYTVFDTVLLGRYVHRKNRFGRPSAEDLAVVRQCMETCGIDAYADRTLSSLSGGERQRVFLARTFAQSTPFLLLDEPANHLDPKVSELLTEQLLSWSEGAESVSLPEAAPAADAAHGSRSSERHKTRVSREGSDAAGQSTRLQISHTVVGVFHDLTLACRLADDLIVMKDGRIAAAGPKEEVLRADLLEEVYGLDLAARMRADLTFWKNIR